jgi:hypothetical protein
MLLNELVQMLDTHGEIIFAGLVCVLLTSSGVATRVKLHRNCRQLW